MTEIECVTNNTQDGDSHFPKLRIEIEYELYCDGDYAAYTFGEGARQDIMAYIGPYSKEGKVEVYKVTKIYEQIA